MPESLFMPRHFRRRYLAYCTLTALTLEGSMVGAAQFWPQNKTVLVHPIITVVDDPSSDDPQPPVPPWENPPPTPDEPTPPPEPEATPEPEDTPPDGEPEMTLDTPRPTPAPSVAKQRPRSAASTNLASSSTQRSNHSRTGTMGVSSAAQAPGPSPIKAVGTWRVSSTPPYPPQARASRVVGSGTIRLTTDASGKVMDAAVSQSSGNALLDNAIAGHAKLKWSGPPNAARTVSFTFRLP